MQRLFGLAALAASLLIASPAQARDYFVRQGSSGDGSKDNPFGDPWQALDVCQSGDAIHVAAGKYTGRLGGGMWEVPFDDVSLFGGYDGDFKTRDPWKNLTQLHWDKSSKNRPNTERFTSTKKNTVLDGFIFDQRDQCPYETEEQLGRKDYPSCDGPMRFVTPATIRNNVIVNPGWDGIVAPAGSTVENNLVVNAVNWGINVKSTTDKQAITTIKNNTIAFTMGFKEPAKGGYTGSGIGLGAPATIVNNIIANSDSNGIYMTALAEKTTLDGNVFFMNLFSNLKSGNDVVVDDKSMDMLEEAGFKKVANNEAKNPGLPVNPKWLDHVSKRTAATPGKLEMDDFNKARQLMGLPLIEKGGSPPSGVAPAMDLADALKLMAPKSAGNAGARQKQFPVNFAAVADAGPQKNYPKVDAATWVGKGSMGNGKDMETTVAISGTGNPRSVPGGNNPDNFAAVQLHVPTGDYKMFLGFYKKGSAVQRVVEKAMGRFNGSAPPPDKFYVIKGTAYALGGYPKDGFIIDEIEETFANTTDTGNRPAGKDWFVKAGSSGGDGSKEKPFKDLWQALEKVEAGDFVHVAGGEYYGKLKTGRWKISVPYISLLGGYDSEFKTRNPWKNPTRLFSPAEFKGRREGYIIEGEDDHTGAIVDGFIFDRFTDNKYKPNGDLDYDNSEKIQDLWLSKPGCIVRNNVFANGAEGAIRIGSGNTLENNIFMNHHRQTVNVQRGFGNAPIVIRNNTFAFSWEIRFGEGNGRNGHLLSIEGGINAIIDNNIFEFADNDALRLMADPGDVVLTNNTFNHNLWANVYRPQGNVAVDDKNFDQLADLKFKKNSGNQVISAGLPVDQKWFDSYLGRTAYTPGKVTMDDWNQLREMLGQPVIATGGQLPEGFMPYYPWDKAAQLFPKNPKVKAGARAKDLPVSFTGIKREETNYEYDEVTWDGAAKSEATWAKLDGKRVSMKVVIRSSDNQVQLAGVSASEYTPFTVTGPDGNDSGGLPLRCYVKKGGKAERTLNGAKSYSSGTPEQWYFIKGIAKPNKQMITEVIERAD